MTRDRRGTAVVESMELAERDGVTTLQWRRVFPDRASRDRVTGFEGQQDSLDEIGRIVAALNAAG